MNLPSVGGVSPVVFIRPIKLLRYEAKLISTSPYQAQLNRWTYSPASGFINSQTISTQLQSLVINRQINDMSITFTINQKSQ
jgi:hypothetical protein